MRSVLGFSLMLVVSSIASAQAPDTGKLVAEVWENALLDDGKGGFIKAGHVHLTIHEVEVDGQKVLRGLKELRLTIRRGNQQAKLESDNGTDELLDGTVVGVSMRQLLGQNQSLVLRGQVEGKRLKYAVEGPTKQEKEIGWDPRVIGIAGEQTFMRDKKPKPGDEFDYFVFEPTIAFVVPVHVKVEDYEEMPVVGGTRKMLRVKATPEKIQGVQLPSSVMWFDALTWAPLQTQVELPGLGKLRMVRATKQSALSPVGQVGGIDLIGNQAIQLDKSVPGIHQQRAVTYRITLKKDDEPLTAFAADGRQSIKAVDGLPHSIDLTIEANRRPMKMDKVDPAPDEYLKSNFYINSDDAKVREYAKLAVGNAKTDRAKVLNVARWVHQNMQAFTYTEAMATADQVAKNLKGDCSEFAMLTAAMCRAEGVASRTALGLIYVEGRPKSMLAFHMWTEVYLDGQWVGIDATLPGSGVGPGHLKIRDCSWYDDRSFKPLLPVMRVIMAEPKAEILRVYPPE